MDQAEQFLAAAREAALAAGHYLLEGLSQKKEVDYKGQVDLVTAYDRRSEEIIYERLGRIFPEHSFLAEEAISREKQSDYLWLVDPLDGTTNYAHGLPVFCVSIALLRREEIIIGVVYDPCRQEMFTAVRGQGAYLNDRPVRVSDTPELGRSLLATGFPYDVRTSPDNNLSHFANFAVRAQAIRRLGSAALDLCYVACGRFDGYWELKLKPWDLAAGALMVREAGGRISDLEGRDFTISSLHVVASNGLIHQAMLEIIALGLVK
ncbi:MAG: inositol monophosphatase [Candidatus Saccharicenans sp.]|jgi:myo-inositol-1(or 4)-monophosphatase|nr:inositol monophosphatase [Candidatus Saccharicenans sp.]MDH7493074.1 inositol monophosphatase family protein [Candidatus Saccharicenans sp.]